MCSRRWNVISDVPDRILREGGEVVQLVAVGAGLDPDPHLEEVGHQVRGVATLFMTVLRHLEGESFTKC